MSLQWKHNAIKGFTNKLIRHIAEAHNIDGQQLIDEARSEKPPPGRLPPIPPPPPRPVTPPVQPPKPKYTGKLPPRPEPPEIENYAWARDYITRILDDEKRLPISRVDTLRNIQRGMLQDPLVARYRDEAAAYLQAVQKRRMADITEPKSIQDVLNTRQDWSEKERTWHKETWQDATPEFLSAMLNVDALRDITANSAKGSYYRPGAHMINMAKGRGGDTWRHEYGHAMDGTGSGGQFSYTCEKDRMTDEVDFLRQFRSDKDVLSSLEQKDISRIAAEHGLTIDDLKKHGGGQDGATYLAAFFAGEVSLASRTRILTRYEERAKDFSPDTGALMDFIGAMTKNAVGYGHKTTYYNKSKTNQTAEMFAEYVELTQGQSGHVYKAILHKIAPNVCPKFDGYISELAKGEI
jgi:hypothetical protein